MLNGCPYFARAEFMKKGSSLHSPSAFGWLGVQYCCGLCRCGNLGPEGAFLIARPLSLERQVYSHQVVSRGQSVLQPCRYRLRPVWAHHSQQHPLRGGIHPGWLLCHRCACRKLLGSTWHWCVRRQRARGSVWPTLIACLRCAPCM
jgi:hypothetical protein